MADNYLTVDHEGRRCLAYARDAEHAKARHLLAYPDATGIAAQIETPEQAAARDRGDITPKHWSTE